MHYAKHQTLQEELKLFHTNIKLRFGKEKPKSFLV